MFELEADHRRIRKTHMFSEAGEAAAVVRQQLSRNATLMKQIAARLGSKPPKIVITCGRGSSDHATVYGKYLIETRIGVLTCSAKPSVSSLYGISCNASDALCIVVSQSGRSPDILSVAEGYKKAGAFVLAFVNMENSPLAKLADEVVPLCAGREKSVAATKSYIAALSSFVHLVAQWSDNPGLLTTLEALPDMLDRAWTMDWGVAAEAFEKTQNLYVLGRGIGYAVAREAALKFKETCSLHGEAYSAAEVLHGPAALIREGFPILAFSQNDQTQQSMDATLGKLTERGAAIFLAGATKSSATILPAITTDAAIEPILMAQSFYRMANTLSIMRGCDPDHPPHLCKVTETV